MFQPRVAILAICGTLVALLAAPAFSQTTGKINGSVRVANGDAILGASVTVTNQQTGDKQTATSIAGGSYEVANLPPGVYTVSADVQGFKGVVVRDQKVDAGATHTVNINLQVKFSEAITVSAMKRDETIQNTPVSVAAHTEESIRDQGIQNIEDVAATTAGFTVQNLGPGQSTVAIRGVSSGQIVRDQAGVKEQVGAYLDESAISLSLFTPDIDLFDMNRVEVLRGPQGTLFGSGSEGGTVRYISNQPQLGLTSTFAEIGGNSIDGGNLGGYAKAGFNAPIGSMVALRADAYYNRFAGWMDAVHPFGSDAPGKFTTEKNVNTGTREGARVAFGISPSESFTITPRFLYQQVNMDGWNRVDEFNILANPYTTSRPAVTLGGTKQFLQVNEPFTDKFSLGDLTMKYDFGPATLTSITSFTNRDILVVRDATALTASVTGGSFRVPESIYTIDTPLYDATQAHSVTQELRVSNSNTNDRFQYVVGGFYSDAHRAYQQKAIATGFDDLCVALGCRFVIPGVLDLPLTPTQGVYAPKDNLYWSDVRYKDRQYAFFGEGTFKVTDQFSVTAGLRYYNFKQDKTLIFDGLFAPFGVPAPPVASVLAGKFDANGVAPRFIASYKVGDTTINAQASKGFRLGGLNDPLLLGLCNAEDASTFGGSRFNTWKDETAWNYEIGSKTTFMGGRGTINASGFYIDVKDLQVVVNVGSCSSRIVVNAPKAKSAGGELEIALAPTDNFDFAISGSYADSTIRQSFNGTENQIAFTGIRDGNRLPSVPKFKMNVAATYQQPIGPGYQGYSTASYEHVGSRYTQLADQELSGIQSLNTFHGPDGNGIGGPFTQASYTFDPLLPSYDILNLRLGIRHGYWDIALYCNNLTNETAFLANDRERDFRARFGYLTNQPRTIGINARIDY